MAGGKRILIGTANPSKLPYLRGYFDGTDIECLSPADLDIGSFDAPENGKTAEENAVEKAAAWYRMAKMPVLALDAGLLFLDLPDDDPDQPGVHVRRAAGHAMDDEEMLWWFAGVARRHGGRLRAAWQDSYCIMRTPDDFRTFTFTRRMLEPNAFIITDTPCEERLPGWPLNSISIDIPTGKYWLRMTDADRAFSKARMPAKDGVRNDLAQWIRTTAAELLGTATNILK